ncbi:MAG: HAMP domain-containing sensor histidine kinase [Acidobacteriota bacterium]
MKFAAKIGIGYAVVIASMFAMLLYQSSVIYQMQSVNRSLSEVSFEAANLSDQLFKRLDTIEEFTRKFLVTRDSDYLEQTRSMKELFAHDLGKIGELNLGPASAEQVLELVQLWEDYDRVDSPLNGDEVEAWLSLQVEHLERLRNQSERVFQEVQRSIAVQVRQATRVGGRAERVSLGVAAVTLGGSLLISLMIVRSFSGRLSQLTRGTRALARGKFGHRLDTGGSDEFADLSGDFNRMAQHLGELDQMKKDFVSHVSHELKSPLGSIQEAIALLLEEIPGSLNEEQKRLLQLNLQSTQRLSAMIGNLLDMSRIDAGMMAYPLKTHDLKALVEAAVGELRLQFDDKAIHLTTEFEEQPVMIQCDEGGFHRVVVNLLGNALKFVPSGGRVGVRVCLSRKVPGQLSPLLQQVLNSHSTTGFALFSVSDNGPGVPDLHKEKIFERFHQLEEGRQGVGLGLAISRGIVEGHHGALWVEDGEEGGSTFKVLLPMRA